MSKIFVLGGGIVGLSTAMMLTRRGHDVRVFERDSEPLPASPEDAWQRVIGGGFSIIRVTTILPGTEF